MVVQLVSKYAQGTHGSGSKIANPCPYSYLPRGKGQLTQLWHSGMGWLWVYGMHADSRSKSP
jgi:hypothetical protein